jgi:catechol 2,3-dioxygenase-like lactoylglutathione lyase family enzyme
MLTGLNHITLAVKDIDKSFDFYVKLLGMKAHAKWLKGAYLTLGDLWFCLNLDKSNPSKDYTHIAFSISKIAFANMKNNLIKHGIKEWKTNTSEGNSFYILDPDGHKLEIHVGDLKSRLKSMKNENFQNLEFF